MLRDHRILVKARVSPDYHPQTQIREEENNHTHNHPSPPPRACKKEVGGKQEKTAQRMVSLVCLANICHSEGEGQPPHQLSHGPGDRSPCALSPGYSLSLTLLVLPSRNLLLDKRQTQQCHTTAKTRKLGTWHSVWGNECPVLSSSSMTRQGLVWHPAHIRALLFLGDPVSSE